jgi:hypothetical protein
MMVIFWSKVFAVPRWASSIKGWYPSMVDRQHIPHPCLGKTNALTTMTFQKLALITLAAAGLASAIAVERRGDATCTFTVLASAAPTPGPVGLETEFNYCKL